MVGKPANLIGYCTIPSSELWHLYYTHTHHGALKCSLGNSVSTKDELSPVIKNYTAALIPFEV